MVWQVALCPGHFSGIVLQDLFDITPIKSFFGCSVQVQRGVHAQLLWGFTDSTLTAAQGLMPWYRWCNLVTGALAGQAAVM